MPSLLAVLLSLAAVLSTAAERPTLTEEQLARLTIRPVSGKPDLYILPGFDGSLSGGNVAVLVTNEGVVLVDNKYAYSHDDITTQVATVTDRKIKVVLNTHHHFDHVGANPAFMRYAQVLSHDNARLNALANRPAGADPAGAAPITYTKTTNLHIGKHTIQVHHLGRGHTNGDSVIFFVELKTVHTGDLFIWGSRLDGSILAPFVDYANGGSAAEWTATLDGILALDFDTAIPGHGPVLTRREIETFRHKFEVLLGRISQAISAGVSREHIASQIDLADLKWPFTPDRIEAIYDELSL